MHELIIPQGKMEKGWIFLQTQHQLILTIQHLSCPRNLKKKKELKCIITFTNELQLASQRERIWWSGICQLLKTMCVINIKEESITTFYHENGHDKMNNFRINFF